MGRGTQRGWVPKHARFTEEAFRPYAIAIGQVVSAWNDFGEQLGDLFWIVMGGGFMNKPIGVWNAMEFDRPKRKALRAAVEGSTPKELDDKQKADIVWILIEADSIETDRNNAAHSPLLLNQNMLSILTGVSAPVRADTLLQNKRAVALEGKNLLDEFRRCRDATLVLRDYAALVHRSLTAERAPWPGRPRLPPRPQKRTPRKEQRRALQRLLKRQRLPSRG
jgi:hypothetical protein